MNVHDNSGSRGGRRAKPLLSPEQIEANYRAALRWREEFRAEKAGGMLRAPAPKSSPRPARRERDAGADRATFAKGIARLEFGRAYWDERLQRGAKERVPLTTKPTPSRRG